MEIRHLDYTENTVKQLRDAYEKAVDSGSTAFNALGCTFDTRYAGYLIEFYGPKYNIYTDKKLKHT